MALVAATATASFLICNGFWAVGGLWGQIAAAAVFGICQALPLLHVMHDSSHLAFGNSETWWQVRSVGVMDGVEVGCEIGAVGRGPARADRGDRPLWRRTAPAGSLYFIGPTSTPPLPQKKQIAGRLAMDFYAGANMTSWHNQVGARVQMHRM